MTRTRSANREALPRSEGGWPSGSPEGRKRGQQHRAPRLLVTGFGPFPGAPDNPTQALVEALSSESATTFGASALRAVVLPTEYQKSWSILRRLYSSFAPEVVLHFGLSSRAKAITIETFGRRACAPDKLDAVGYAPRWARRSGPALLRATLPAARLVTALRTAGFSAELSEDAGGYVCNATLYRSLLAAPRDRQVGFVHVPPMCGDFTKTTLYRAAALLLQCGVGLRSTGSLHNEIVSNPNFD